MSEAMIKRWNEITVDRSEGPAAASSKRSRPRSRSPSSDESEDNISIVSRSPSPPPRNDKEEDISVYDRYIRGPTHEPVTVNTKISSTNKGFGMLAKMGWKEGEGLGASGQGRTDPIPFLVKLDALGLGRSSHDERIIESTVSQRRELDSERMVKETEEQRKAREEAVAAMEHIKTEVKDTLRSFFCVDCEKQYSNVAQYDEHLRSYAHTHVVRMKEQQATARQRQSGESAARKAKEKKREEKEMKRMAAAAGIKYSNGPATSSSIIVPAQTAIKSIATSSGGGFAPVSGPPAKKGGWSAVTAIPEPSSVRSFASVSTPVAAPSGFKKTGWAAVGAPPPRSPSPAPAPKTESQDHKQPTNKTGGFMRGGWTTLDTTTGMDRDIEMASPAVVSSTHAAPPPPPPPAEPAPPPPPPPEDTLPPPPPPPPDRHEPSPPPHSVSRGHPESFSKGPRTWNSKKRW